MSFKNKKRPRSNSGKKLLEDASAVSKKHKTNTKEEEEGGNAHDEQTPNAIIEPSSTTLLERPKSKKELRKERKLAQQKTKVTELHETTTQSVATGTTIKDKGTSSNSNIKNKIQTKLEKKEQVKRQAAELGEQKRLERKRKQEEKERALELRFQEQDRIRREKEQQQPSSVTKKKNNNKKEKEEHAQNTSKKISVQEKEPQRDLSVLQSIFQKKVDPTTGVTTCRLGVQYRDRKVGTGPVVGRKDAVTVRYQLWNGCPPHGMVLDSSKKFTFRLGKGEVIQGWDIGLEGIHVGGTRHLIVPPKAGYGSKDIGAGPGAVLHFIITVLDVR